VIGWLASKVVAQLLPSVPRDDAFYEQMDDAVSEVVGFMGWKH
jgi:hypothetical protein